MSFLRSLFRVIEGFIVFYLVFFMLRWYFKGHFGKHAIFFWLYTIITIIYIINRPDHNPNWPQRDSRTGAELWEEQYGK
jgi:hypothetical protein